MELLSRKETDGLTALRRQLNRLFGDFYPEDLGPSAGASWAPVLDVVETPEAVVVKLEVPGVDPKEIDVSMSGDVLHIQGEKREEREEKGKAFHRVERSYGAFRRSITLPATVKAERVEAETKDGVLTITLPKALESMPRRITVKAK